MKNKQTKVYFKRLYVFLLNRVRKKTQKKKSPKKLKRNQKNLPRLPVPKVRINLNFNF